jgi:hypothetical protein
MAKKENDQANTQKKQQSTDEAIKKSKYPAPPKYGGLD